MFTGRVGLQSNDYNPLNLPLLDSKHPVTKLYVRHVNELNHSGVDQTVAYVKMKFWIPNCRKLSKNVKRIIFFAVNLIKFSVNKSCQAYLKLA